MRRKKLNPNIKLNDNNRYYLLFTVTEGENFKAINFSKERYEKLLVDTYFEYEPADFSTTTRVYPSVAFLLKATKAHDFVIRQLLGERLATGQIINFKSRRFGL